MRAYTDNQIRSQALDQLEEDPTSFYKSNIINYKGVVKNGTTPYTEAISEVLLGNFDKHILRIGKGRSVRSTKTFRIDTHDGYSNITNRLDRFQRVTYSEKGYAIGLFNGYKTGTDIGTLIDYEIPLNEHRDDGNGKIDLLANEGNHFKLIELKIHRPNGDETLLRSIMEIFTYYMLIRNNGLIEKFIGYYQGELRHIDSIRLAILSESESLSAETMKCISNHPNLNGLVHRIGEYIGFPVEGYVFSYSGRGKPFKQGKVSCTSTSTRVQILLDGNVTISRLL